MAKRDIIHKTGSTQHSAMPPEKDRAMATGDLHKKLHEDRSSSSRDMLTDRQTHRQTDKLIAILRTPTWAE